MNDNTKTVPQPEGETNAATLLSKVPATVQESSSVYIAESAIHGRGLFAERDFEEGETIGQYRGIPTEEDGTYVLWLYEGGAWHGIEGTGPLRFLNHSCEPNADFDGTKLYALRAIARDEEITFHYGEEWEDLCDEPTKNGT